MLAARTLLNRGMRRHPPARIALLVLATWIVLGHPAETAGEIPYRIGPDDLLLIEVLDRKDLQQMVAVRVDGRISLPLVGVVEAAGLTPEELSSRLTTEYRRTLPGAWVAVAVKEVRSRPAYVAGAVGRPGQVQLIGELTVLDALSAAGGLDVAADPEAAFVQRKWDRIAVNVRRLLEGHDQTQNISLQPGDTVVVPLRGTPCPPRTECVWVSGAVRKPGAVRYRAGLTSKMAIAEAGGSPNRVTVTIIPPRARPVGHHVEKVLWCLQPDRSPTVTRSDARETHWVSVPVESDPLLRPGDQIFVTPSLRLF